MPSQFRRKIIRLPLRNYVGRRLYFVTICCENRQPIFAVRSKAEWLLGHLRESAATHDFQVHAYSLMPDHLHLLVAASEHTSNLIAFVARLKQRTAYDARKRFGVQLWQKHSYDHVLRRDVAMDAVAWYIWMNPVRKGLCADPAEYAFSGSLTMEWPRKSRPTVVWRPPWKTPAPGVAAV